MIENITQYTTDIARNNNSFYNPACITEVNRIIEQCEKLKADVYSAMNVRMKYMLIAVAVTIILIWIYDYVLNDKLRDNRIIKFIYGRLRFLIIMLAIIMIAYFFI